MYGYFIQRSIQAINMSQGVLETSTTFLRNKLSHIWQRFNIKHPNATRQQFQLAGLHQAVYYLTICKKKQAISSYTFTAYVIHACCKYQIPTYLLSFDGQKLLVHEFY